MSAAGIFIFGFFVFVMVCAALGVIVWGIVEDRRSRAK
jgi:hypothetical protein